MQTTWRYQLSQWLAALNRFIDLYTLNGNILALDVLEILERVSKMEQWLLFCPERPLTHPEGSVSRLLFT